MSNGGNNGMGMIGGSPGLTPEIAMGLQRAAQQEQRKVIEAMIHIELPMILINSLFTQPLGELGVKVVMGEASEAIPGGPMKPRASVMLPWFLAHKLAQAILQAEQAAGIVPPVD